MAKSKDAKKNVKKEPEKTEPTETIDKSKYDDLAERYRNTREEGIRLKKELVKVQKPKQKEKEKPGEEENLEAIIDRKLQERIAPLTKEQEKK